MSNRPSCCKSLLSDANVDGKRSTKTCPKWVQGAREDVCSIVLMYVMY